MAWIQVAQDRGHWPFVEISVRILYKKGKVGPVLK
jgi:hypothetical protein